MSSILNMTKKLNQNIDVVDVFFFSTSLFCVCFFLMCECFDNEYEYEGKKNKH